MKRNITFDEAVEILRGVELEAKGREKLFLHDALGRVLAQDIVAESDMPPYPTAAMDGYACCSLEVAKAESLEILGDMPAGSAKSFSLAAGAKQCVKTFTGAKMAEGADTLLLVEDAQVREGRLFVTGAIPAPGVFIRQKGDNYRAGEVLLTQGTLITPAEIGLLASLNQVYVQVYQKPVVTILSGGDELVEIGAEQREGVGLRSVNNHLLKALITSLGGEARITDLLPDHLETIETALKRAIADSDLVLLTGGMSMGDYDFTQRALYNLTDRVFFHGVKMKPGKPVAYAKKGETHILGLPGFPNSCLITFFLLGKILFDRLLGRKGGSLAKIRARLDEGLKKEAGRCEFRVCTLHLAEDGEWRVDFAGKKGFQSAIINNLCGPTALVKLEELCTSKEAGESVEVILFKPLEALF